MPILKAYSIRLFEPTNNRSRRYFRMISFHLISVYSPTQCRMCVRVRTLKYNKYSLANNLYFVHLPSSSVDDNNDSYDAARGAIFGENFLFEFQSRFVTTSRVFSKCLSLNSSVQLPTTTTTTTTRFFHTFEISLNHHQCFKTKFSKPSVKTL